MITPEDYLSAVREAIYPSEPYRVWPPFGHSIIKKLFPSMVLGKETTAYQRRQGIFWPISGYTMIGLKRLEAIREDIQNIKAEGDLVEFGVWRGGALIWMCACLKAYNQKRRVIGFDTFNGFENWSLTSKDKPKTFVEALGSLWFQIYADNIDYLKVSKEKVEQHLDLFNLSASLIEGPVQKTITTLTSSIAFARIDVDTYDPVKTCIEHLWPKLSIGGIIHIDDYYVCSGCKLALDEFRQSNKNIKQEDIDSCCIKWTKL